MTNLNYYFKNYTTTAVLAIGLLFFIFSSFKPLSEEKQVMTIDLWVGAPKENVGIHVYIDGKKIEFVPSVPEQKTEEQITNTGLVFNKALTKYYKEGWRVVAIQPEGSTVGTGYARYILEK